MKNPISSRRPFNYTLGATLLALVLAGCGSGSQPPASPAPAELSPKAKLGKALFFDTGLSASGVQSCATCHVASRAHAADDNLAVPLGGTAFTATGFRNTPALNYLQFNPAFGFDKDGTPVGGMARDGRADTFAIQARGPFFAAHEMANRDPQEWLERLQKAPYASEFQRFFGEDIFTQPELALDRATLAIAQFEKEDTSFRPFNSKFDGFLKGTAQLNEQELRGFALFNDPNKGNCAACHPSSRSADGTPPLFTDFSYDNLGVPRNGDIPANANPAYFDLGLCGPIRTDLTDRSDLCGAFKVPSLRNVAITAPYFHNGKFAKLRDVVAFYVRRDTHPEQWYPQGPEGVEKFNDLPALYRINVNTTEAPYNRNPGDQPALNDTEIDAVVAFLNTLTDGYSPNPQD